MRTLKVTHSQRRYGEANDPPQTDVLGVVQDLGPSGGLYFRGTPDSVYRWGCSRTYAMPLEQALRAFMAENGQSLHDWEEVP